MIGMFATVRGLAYAASAATTKKLATVAATMIEMSPSQCMRPSEKIWRRWFIIFATLVRFVIC